MTPSLTPSRYDPAGRVTTRTYPTGGGVEQYGYSTNIAAMTSYTNQIGYLTTYAYDAQGRKAMTVAGYGTADAVTNSFSYNAAGDLIKVHDGKNNRITFKYDPYGLLLCQLDANDLEILHYTYDAAGRLTRRWSIAKGDTLYWYDAVHNLTSKQGNMNVTYGYDNFNRLISMVDNVGTTTYTYDNTGNMLTEDGPWVRDTVKCAYTNDLRTSLSLLLGSYYTDYWYYGHTYGYDAANRMTNVSYLGNPYTYRYPVAGGNLAPASGLPVELDLPCGSILRNYDNVARLTNTVLRNASQTILNAHAYAYNNAGQRTRMTASTAGNYLDYGYDALGQLTNATGHELSGGAVRAQEQWTDTYDKAGNLIQRTKNQLTETFGVDANNQLTAVNSSGTLTVAGTATAAATSVTVNGQAATLYNDKTFTLTGVARTNTTLTAVAGDGQGHTSSHTINVNLAAQVVPQYDGNGNLTNDGCRSFTYDAENQFVGVVVSNSPASSTQSGFVYDGLGRRRIRTEAIYGSGGWVTNQVVRYIYDGKRVLQERDGNNNELVTYIRGLDLSGTLEGAGGIGGLIARTCPYPSYIYYYFHSDGNGNITAIMNGAQNLIAQYRYDPFGNLISQFGSLAEANLYRFSTKEFHPASGLYYYGSRFYDPNLQRWLNRDPSGTKDGPNLYAFAHNGPINGYDSWGMDWTDYVPQWVANLFPGYEGPTYSPSLTPPSSQISQANIDLLREELGGYDATQLRLIQQGLLSAVNLNPIYGTFNAADTAITGTDPNSHVAVGTATRFQAGA